MAPLAEKIQAQSAEKTMANPRLPPRRPYWKKPTFMFLNLGLGVHFALGQHFYYSFLNKKPPGETAFPMRIFGDDISEQKVNTAVGNTLAYLAQVNLAFAIAAAHDQISWRTIKSHPTELGVIDTLFSTKSSWPSALDVRLWVKMPLASLLLLAYVLLPLVSFITPSTITLENTLVNQTANVHIPRVDFTSTNFVSLPWNLTYLEMDLGLRREGTYTFDIFYGKPQPAVKKAIEGSLISNAIQSITSPMGQNSSWNLDFNGPALACKALEDGDALRTEILAQIQASRSAYSYLSWVPGANGSLPFTVSDNGYTLSSATLGGSPLSLYITVPQSNISSADMNQTTTENYQYPQASTSLIQCILQNVTYSAGFTYLNGTQSIQLRTSPPLNNVSSLPTLTKTVADPTLAAWDPAQKVIDLQELEMETFAYQSVMDTFASMFVGDITPVQTSFSQNKSSILFSSDTLMTMTPLVKAAELVNLTTSLALQSANLGSAAWDGRSVEQVQTTTQSMASMIEEMFRNATISLMSEPSLNPNYTSIYAPSNVTVKYWYSENVYQYSTNTLWIVYGSAIGLAALCVLAGTAVVVTSQAAYSSEFSTFLRVAHNVSLSSEVALQDTSGKDPLPKYLEKTVVRFPSENALMSNASGEMQSVSDDLHEMDRVELLEHEGRL
ncbi:hypothetical protein BP6252_11015 [Coleophoma cylindrospora]|uniref:Uncharacterized protein n=1 Tax=Coleophoma cylindrospora TaxID=1849047 RepID=A0A3D8QPA5_9HELO|nr:hypothetical protein BP6252_11015 [Coleophoma cylindrospora]